MTFSIFAKIGLAAALLSALPPVRARADSGPFASEAARGSYSSARLLSAGPASGGAYLAGVEIELQSGAITYWRQPGESGAPPVFDFSASENVAAAEPLFPVPKHLSEAGMVVAGYDAGVVFPVRVTPKDLGKPVVLTLALDYAACGQICLPAKARLSLALPTAGASPFAARLRAAEASTPRRLGETEAARLVALTPAGKGAWRLVYRGHGAASDIFVEAPEPYFADSARNESGGFDIKLTGGPDAPVAARATIATDKGGIEIPLTLK
jgi:DsbC/DsbD-like thiol-disulfide interchange protein